MKRRALLAGIVPLAHASAHAQPARWPARPVRWIVAYPPGGVSDEISRALAGRLAERLGVPVLIEHRPGAGGNLAMEAIARGAPDGHLLAFSAISPLTLSPLLGPMRRKPSR